LIEFFTVEQAAKELQVSDRTIRNLISRGRFPHAAKIDPQSPHSTWRIPRADLVTYQQQQAGHVQPQ
jgi:excisionase family DNA binding protein